MDYCKNQGQEAYLAPERGIIVAGGRETRTPLEQDASAATLPASQWDLQELLERLDGDEEFLRELLVIFQSDAAEALENARAALAARNYPDLTRAAHTLKGMLKNLAMKKAGQAAASLEEAARKESAAETGNHYRLLEREMNELWPHVEARLGEVKP